MSDNPTDPHQHNHIPSASEMCSKCTEVHCKNCGALRAVNVTASANTLVECLTCGETAAYVCSQRLLELRNYCNHLRELLNRVEQERDDWKKTAFECNERNEKTKSRLTAERDALARRLLEVASTKEQAALSVAETEVHNNQVEMLREALVLAVQESDKAKADRDAWVTKYRTARAVLEQIAKLLTGGW